jgi:hypothetical protein
MMRAIVLGLLAASSWSTPHVLSNGDIALGPELAVSPSGAALAVWDHESGPDCAQAPASLTCIHIVEVATRNSNGAWSWRPEEVARPGIGARPKVALNEVGRAAIIWVHDIGRDRVVQATYRTGASEGFPNPSDLSAAVLEVRNHQVGLDAAGNAAVVWAERHDQDFDVAGEMRSVASGTWAAPIVLSTGSVRSGPSLAVTPAGEAFAVWIEGSSVLLARGDLTNGVWDRPIALANDAGVGAAVATNANGDVVVVWGRNQAGIEAAVRSGGSWTEPVELVGSGRVSAAVVPDVSVGADGTAVAVWEGGLRVQAAVRSRDGHWSDPVTVGDADTSAPLVAVDSHGDAIAAWIQSGRLVAAVRPAAVGVWQPVEELSGAEVTEPRVALDAAGHGIAVWNLRNGDSLPVMTADFPAAWTPTLENTRRPAIRGRARVGRTVVCNRGEWTGTVPISYAYSWLRNGATVARGSRYRVRLTDAGASLACRVKATNGPNTLVALSRSVRVRR